MPGVRIGDGCTVGASSVVTKDILSFSVAIGSPARVVKHVRPVPDIPRGIS
jgi:acetyltransferase-like isoleucine patch superfamily enzyme